MEEKTIEQYKTIAEFLGGEVSAMFTVNDIPAGVSWKGEVAQLWRKEKLGISIGNCILVEQLAFDRSWDWIMPAYIKFRDTSHMTIKREYQDEFEEYKRTLKQWVAESCSPLPVFHELAEAILWYNSIIVYQP